MAKWTWYRWLFSCLTLIPVLFILCWLGEREPSDCWDEDVLPPENYTLLGLNSSWTHYDTFVFLSAHYDHRDGSVNLITHSRTIPPMEFPSVRVWYTDEQKPTDVSKPYVYNINGKFDSHYTHSPLLIKFFPVRSDRYSIPYAVSLMSCKEKPIFMAVLDPGNYAAENKSRVEFALCVAPMFDTKTVTVQSVMSFIEMYRLLGVGHFVMHVHKASPEVLRLLKMYSKKGIVAIEQWPLYEEKNGVERVVEYFGQSTAYMRCLYLYLKRAKHLIIADLDEILAPRGAGKLSLRDVVSNSAPKAASWLFPHQVFPLEVQSHNKYANNSQVKELGLTPLLHTGRMIRTFRTGERSKYIVRTDRLVAPTVHRPDIMEGYKEVVLELSEGMVQHYRRGFYEDKSAKLVEDHYTLQFADRLINSTQAAVEELRFFGMSNERSGLVTSPSG